MHGNEPGENQAAFNSSDMSCERKCQQYEIYMVFTLSKKYNVFSPSDFTADTVQSGPLAHELRDSVCDLICS